MILLTKHKYKSLDIVNIQPVAVIKTIDNGEVDDKIICVNMEENIRIDKLFKKVMKFLKTYKGKNANTQIDTTYYNVEEALNLIEKAHKSYKNKFVLNDVVIV